MQDMEVRNIRHKRYASLLTQDHVSVTFMAPETLHIQGNFFFLPQHFLSTCLSDHIPYIAANQMTMRSGW